MPTVTTITSNQQAVSIAESKQKITGNLKKSDSVFDGLLAAADILAEVRQKNPSKVSQFMQNFKKLIQQKGFEALLILKQIAEFAKTATGIDVRQSSSRIDLKTPAKNGSNDLPKGFLWKPASDNPPYNLVILTPPDWTGNVSRVEVVAPDGDKGLANGVFSGVANGDREHYRFSMPGRNLPDLSFVRILFKNGQQRMIEISDTSARFES